MAPFPANLSSEHSNTSIVSLPYEESKIKLRLCYLGIFSQSPSQEWKYAGGQSFNDSVPLTCKYADFMYRVTEKVGAAVSAKYQSPGEELDPDSLITVQDDSDLQEMFDEYLTHLRCPDTPSPRTFRIRVFLFAADETPRYPEELMDGEDGMRHGGDPLLLACVTDSVDSEGPLLPDSWEDMVAQRLNERMSLGYRTGRDEDSGHDSALMSLNSGHLLHQQQASGQPSPTQDPGVRRGALSGTGPPAAALQAQYFTPLSFPGVGIMGIDSPPPQLPSHISAFGEVSASNSNTANLPSHISAFGDVLESSSDPAQEHDPDDAGYTDALDEDLEVVQQELAFGGLMGTTPPQRFHTQLGYTDDVQGGESERLTRDGASENGTWGPAAELGGAIRDPVADSGGLLGGPAFGLPREAGGDGALQHAGATNGVAGAERAGRDGLANSGVRDGASERDDKGGALHTVQRVPKDAVRVMKKIGEGAFGEVSLATAPIFGTVAIKWLKPERFQRHEQSFWREAALMKGLNHPNVLRFFGVVVDTELEDAKVVGIITEFVKGGSLAHYLRNRDGRLIPLRTRCDLALNAVNGLAYLHEMRVVHFDLKPDNLLLSSDGADISVKVADFGLSKEKWQSYVSGCKDLRGTLPYMAPELVADNMRVSEKADVWSVGVVMWEMLTLETPYQELTPQQILMGLMCGNLHLQVPESCEPEWRGLLETCIDYNPTSRPAMRDLAKQLEAIRDQQVA